MLLLLSGAASHPGGPTPRIVSAQGAPTDADLERASAGRSIRLGTASNGVTEIPLEVYVARVVAGEGEPDAPDATRQALAIAVRTFAIANAGRHRREGFDLCDRTHCQVPRAAVPATRRAAMATAGRVLTHDGAPAEVFYSASCGGRSESASQVWPGADLPYLRSVVDDVHADDAPWIVDLTLAQIRQALGRRGFSGNRLTDVVVEARSDSGRAARLRLAGLRPDVIAGEPFRAALGARTLRSTAFTIERRGETLRFTGSGYGHGVGMCVVGAGRRARRGESAAEILRAYYPGLALEALDTLAPTFVIPPSDEAVTSTASPPPAAERGEPSRNAVVAHVPPAGPITADDLTMRAARAYEDMAAALQTTAAPIAVELHASVESFRTATGRPWWIEAAVAGRAIDLAPAALLGAGTLDRTLRFAMAELLMAPALAGRPVWVRLGGARYFARTGTGALPSGPGIDPGAGSARSRRRATVCPADAELTLAISAAAQREADARADACFVRAISLAKDWRAVR